MNVGYIRVSSVDQNASRQLDGLILDKIFIDKVSGKNIERVELKEMIGYVREGDSVYVHSMDRLARNLVDLITIVQGLVKKGVIVNFISENLKFTSEKNPMSQLLLSIMGAFGEFEHQLIRERQREGIALARARGVYKGRSKCLTEDQIKELQEMGHIEGISKTYLARKFKISRASLYKYIKEIKKD